MSVNFPNVPHIMHNSSASVFIYHINIYYKADCSTHNFANSILFADDTSIINSNTDLHEFKHNIDVVLQETNNWFICNLLTLNYNKTHFLQFFVKKQNEIKIRRSYRKS